MKDFDNTIIQELIFTLVKTKGVNCTMRNNKAICVCNARLCPIDAICGSSWLSTNEVYERRYKAALEYIDPNSLLDILL